MVQGQLVLVQLREHRANIQVRISLSLGPLQTTLDRERALQEVERCAHLADSPIVARHVVEGHGLTELVGLAKLLALLEQVERRVDVLLLQVVDGEDVANFAQLLARLRKFFRVRAEVGFLNFEKLLEDADGLNILGLALILPHFLLEVLDVLQSRRIDLGVILLICVHFLK